VRSLPQILALYEEIDNGFEQEQQTAAADAARIDKIEESRRLNDQAYFVLCWGQLEAEINEVCREAIRRRRDNPQWSVRRGWDLYNPDDSRLSGLGFEDRAALVLDRKAGRGSPWARVMHYYALRNQIAHGNVLLTRTDVTKAVQDFYQIQGALSR
jgi:hypothetical protein